MNVEVNHQPDNDLDKKPDVYDIVIHVNNLPEVGKLGWSVELSTQLKTLAKEELSQKIKLDADQHEVWLTQAQLKELSRVLVPDGNTKTVVAVVGLFDRGKTYLLNKLSGSRFPTGQRVHTKGLSITLPVKSHNLTADVILLDTEGSAAPLPRVRLSDNWDADWEANYWARAAKQADELKERRAQALSAPDGLSELEQGLLSTATTQQEEDPKENESQTSNVGKTAVNEEIDQWRPSDAQRGLSDAEWEQLEEEKERDRAKELSELHEKAIVSKKVTENFLQNLVYSISNVLLIVVNELTWPDQQYIASVCQSFARSDSPAADGAGGLPGQQQTRSIIVVHNFKRTQTNKEFLECRKRYVEDCFPGRMSKQPWGSDKFIDVWAGYYHGVMLRHVCFGCEDSEAGNIHNPGALAFLQSFMNNQQLGMREELLPRLCYDMRASLRSYIAVGNNSSVGILVDRKFNLRMTGKNCGRLLQDHVVYRDNAVFLSRPDRMTPAVDIVRNEKMQLVIADLPMPPIPGEGPSIYEQIKPATYSAKIDIRPTSRDLVIAGKRTLFYRQVANGTILPQKVTVYAKELENLILQERPSGDFERRLPLSYDLHHKPEFVTQNDGQMQILIKKIED